MKPLKIQFPKLLAILGGILLAATPAFAVSTFITQQGGTGTTTPSGILYGDNGATNHLNTVTIGSNLTFSGGTLSASVTGSNTVSTSTIPTIGQLAYWTSNAFPSLLGSVATTSHSFSSSFTITGTLGALVGGTNSSVDLSNTGVTAGIYGTSTSTPQLTVDAQGRLSLVTNVPIAIAGSKAYYSYATQATSSAAYFNQNPTASTTSSTASYVLSNATNQFVQNWISPVGDPGIAVIPGGNYIVDFFAWRSSGSAAITLAFQIWEVSSTGADISQIGTTNSTPNLTNTKAQYQVSFTTGEHTMASSASRILLRAVATTAGTPTLSLAMGGADQMDLVTPGATVDVTNFVPYSGATANVNLGAFGLTTNSLSVASLSGLLAGNTGTVYATASSTLYGTGTAGQVLEWSNGAPAWVATTTAGMVTAVTGTYPIVSSGGFTPVISIAFGTTTANSWSLLQQFNGNASSSQMSITASGHLYIPNAANPTIAFSGDLAINTTTASSSLRYYDGSAERSLFPDGNGGLPFASSTLAYLGSYGTAGTTTITQMRFSRPASLLSFYCDTDVGTAYVLIGNGTASTTGKCTVGGTLTSSSVTWVMGQAMVIQIGDEATNPNLITVSPQVRKDSD